MNAVQAHRGPDGQGVFEDPQREIALGHVRLAILDLSERASQPMVSPAGRYVLVFNGEIYNFPELRDELAADGIGFRSSGDTEVLLRGLEKHGEAFVPRLNGMFAFALWDNDLRELLLARDHLGIKPLYYTEPEPGTLLFASEIKALCAHPRMRREPDFVTLQQHLAFCYASGDRTALKGVRRLAPGTMLKWSARDGTYRVCRYWSPDFSSARNTDFSAAADQLRTSVRSAVARQMISDVPVGSYLSGGLDSSLITLLAAGHAPAEFACYTITYPASDNRLDQMREDAPYARRLARESGLRLKEVEVQANVASLLPLLIRHLDEPIADPAAITCYLISRLAREDGVPVLLSGQGADELFGGYPSYRAVDAARWFDMAPKFVGRAIGRLAGLAPGAYSGRLGATLRRARRLLQELPLPPEKRFLNYCCKSPPHEVRAILHDDFRRELNGADATDECCDHILRSGLSGLDRFLERDLSVYLPNHNLLYTDKMGMAVGLEARVPLLDVDLVNLATRLPAEYKVSRGALKRVLREAARGIVPEEIIRRPKTGFGAPFRKWLRHDLAELWNDLTNDRAVQRRGWFSSSALRSIRSRSQSGRCDLYMLQWAVLTMELWAQQFVDENPAAGDSKPNEPNALERLSLRSA